MNDQMNHEIKEYNNNHTGEEQAICNKLSEIIDNALPDAESKVWHAHPVWFLDGNPIVGYSKLKGGIRLLFWSGQSFNAVGLKPEGNFKAAEARYNSVNDIDENILNQWLEKARAIQWDYKNIVRRKGELLPLIGLNLK